MTKTFYYISSPASKGAGFFQSFIRIAVLIMASIAGVFIFAASAAFAFFVVVGLAIFGLVTFAVLWLRAKILGRPLMPKPGSYRETTFTQAEGFEAGSDHQAEGSGPILDAHQTPEGWSVETD